MKPPMTGIDPSHVGQVVQDFVDFDQVKQMSIEKASDGTFTVTPLA